MTRRLPCWLQEFGVLLFFAAASLVTTYPVALHLFDAIPGWAGDPMVFFFSIWWYGQEGFNFINQPVVPYIFHPYGVPYHRYGDFAPINVLLLPVIRSLGPIFTYNLSMILSFILSAYFTFLLARNLTGSWKAGILSGTFFSFSAYHFSRVIGHLNLMHIEWFPLLILATKMAIDTQKLRYFLLAGVSYTLLFLSSGYYAYIGALLIVPFAFLYLRWSGKRLPVLPTLVAIAIPAILLFPFIYSTLQLKSTGIIHGSIGWTYIHSADLLNYFWYNPFSMLFGKTVMSVPLKTSIPTEQALYLGMVPLALAAIALLSRKSRSFVALHAKIFALIGISFVILSLGPVLKMNNDMAVLPVDGSRQILAKASELVGVNEKERQMMLELKGLPIPMPYLVPYFTLPFFNTMRVPSRFGIIVYLSVAVLAGIGYSILEKAKPKKLAGTIFVAALLIYSLEIMPSPYPTMSPKARPVDDFIASQPGDFAIIEYPVSIYDCDYLGHIPFHKKEIVNFCSSFLPPNAVETINKLKIFPPSEDALDFFRKNNVRYALVNYLATYEYVNYTGPKEQVPGLEFVGKFGDIYLYSPAT